MKRLRGIFPALLAALALAGGPASASGDSPRPKPGIDEKHGAVVPLDVPFLDEDGNPVVLRDIVKRPVLLLPVYYRCQNICNPTLRELQRALDQLDLRPGKDFDIVTFSIDEADTPELARITKKNLLAGLKHPVDPAGWRFLTGKPADVLRLTDAMGFYYQRMDGEIIHASTLVFLSKDGKIIRYLPGLTILPVDLKMGILDAAEGTPRPLIEKIQRLCFRYDPAKQTYVFRVNMLIFAATGGFVAAFVLFLVLRRRALSEKKVSVLQ